MRSFIVTGESACGKTTLVNEAMKHGYIHLPTHTTRGQRPGEIQEVHNAFLNRSCFEENFRNGIYLESSLEYAENIGVYYSDVMIFDTTFLSPSEILTKIAEL